MGLCVCVCVCVFAYMHVSVCEYVCGISTKVMFRRKLLDPFCRTFK